MMAQNPISHYIESIKRELTSEQFNVNKTPLEQIVEWTTMEFGARFMDIELTEKDVV